VFAAGILLGLLVSEGPGISTNIGSTSATCYIFAMIALVFTAFAFIGKGRKWDEMIPKYFEEMRDDGEGKKGEDGKDGES